MSTFFSNVGMGLPWSNQYLAANKVSCSSIQGSDSDGGTTPTSNPSTPSLTLYQVIMLRIQEMCSRWIRLVGYVCGYLHLNNCEKKRLGQDCINGNVYYYMRVVQLVCGFNQSHSIILLYMEWLLWQDCTNRNVYY